MMGTFTLLPPVHYIGSSPILTISSVATLSTAPSPTAYPSDNSGSSHSVHSECFFFWKDPWIAPNLLEVDYIGESMPLSAAEFSYQAIQMASANPDPDPTHPGGI